MSTYLSRAEARGHMRIAVEMIHNAITATSEPKPQMGFASKAINDAVQKLQQAHDAVAKAIDDE